MDEKRQIPASLKVVAVLFILEGVLGIIETLVSLGDGRLNINGGVFGLFIGPGLLALRPGWRTCALVSAWIGMVGVPLAGILILFGHIGQPSPLDPKLLGLHLGWLGVAITVVIFFALSFWQYRVLTRPDVCTLFERLDQQQVVAADAAAPPA